MKKKSPTPERVITIDIGNTTIALGVFESGRLAHVTKIPTALFPGKALPLAETGYGFSGAVYCSVVPAVNARFEAALQASTGILPRRIHHADAGIPIHVPDPGKVGTDRIVNAASAVGLGYRPPLVVVDLGTATTFSVLDREGAFIGGAICPGVSTSLKALSAAGAQLPDISADGIPGPAVAADTEGCMRSGSLYGNASLIEGMVARMEAELGYPLRIVLTGGHAPLIHPFLKCRADRRDDLLMQGLYLLYQQVTKKENPAGARS